MENDIIYLQDAKVYHLQKSKENEIWGESFSDDEIKKISKIEDIGKPFNLVTEHTFEDIYSEHYQKDKIFFEDMKPHSKLEYYLTKAEIPFKFGRPENVEPQKIGLIHGRPTNISSGTKIDNKRIGIPRSIIPCKFYLLE